MDLGLKDKVALVTGASAGLGWAAARTLYDEGATVAICSRNEDNISQAAERISGDGDRILPLVCDLSDKSQIDGMISRIVLKLGRIDILVTNCGGPPTGTHATISEKDWQTGYNRTFMSAIRLINGVVPGMKERGFGRVILITSFSAKQPIDNLMLSNSYRAGLLGYAKTLSREVGPYNITVNTVLPGFTATERLADLAKVTAAERRISAEDVYSEWMGTVPVGRLGEPNELGALIAFLASNKAGYITGTSTAVDGGRLQGIL